MKKIFSVIIGFSLLICGCDKPAAPTQGNIHTDSVTTTTTTTAVTSTAADVSVSEDSEDISPFPIILNDVEIAESPQRVISTSPSITEIIFEMGYGERLVARSSYCDYPPEAMALSDLGSSSDPNIDMMIEMNPDVVFTSTALASTDIFTLNKEGIQVIHIPAPKNAEEFQSVYRLIGYAFEGIFNGEIKGDEAYSEVETALASIENTGKTFVYITENLEAATNDTLEGSILGLYGENAAGNAVNYSFDKSYLTEVTPDFIFLNSIYTAEDLASDEILGTLDAVTSGRVIPVDNSYFERPSARIAELIETLNQMIADLE